MPPVGAFCWSECLTSDPAAGAEFYTKLFGWSVKAEEVEVAGSKSTYHIFNRGEKMAAGCMDLPEPAKAAGAPVHWLNYIFVDDVDTMAEKAKGLGAEITCPPLDITGVGRFCVMTDPQGGVVAFFKSEKAGA